jgi:hypothetical protein
VRHNERPPSAQSDPDDLASLIAAALEAVVQHVVDAAITRSSPQHATIERSAPEWIRTQKAAAAYCAMPLTAFIDAQDKGLIKGRRFGRCWYFRRSELDGGMDGLPLW